MLILVPCIPAAMLSKQKLNFGVLIKLGGESAGESCVMLAESEWFLNGWI